MPIDWSPHMKLDYAKVCIRTVVERAQAERKKKEKSIEECVNEEIELLVEALQDDKLEPWQKNGLMDRLEDLRNQKAILVEEKGKRLASKLGTKWYNEGEKSTRYFLRLMNRVEPDEFKEIESADGETVVDKDAIEKEIVNFYKELYESYDKTNLVINDVDEFYDSIPQVLREEASTVTKPITADELRQTLHKTKDSAPGPDGIPYSVLGHLWPIVGQLIVDAWNHSLQTGKLCQSHQVSFLRLIPKAGKDLR
jgi:hypothetical protein